MEFIVYNIFNPALNRTFIKSVDATDYMFSMGDEYDVTDIKSFKSWYPDIKI